MRVKTGPTTRQRRKRWLKKAEGTHGINHKSYRNAKQTVIKSSQYAYRDRKNKKRDFRRLWIQRINSSVRKEGYTIHILNSWMRYIKKELLSIEKCYLN